MSIWMLLGDLDDCLTWAMLNGKML